MTAGIFKALHKLRTKISSLEQVRILEKNTQCKDVQAEQNSDVTIADVQVELLRTQLHYLIKIAKEYPKSQFNLSAKSKLVLEEDSQLMPPFVKGKINPMISREDASSSTSDLLDKNFLDDLSPNRNPKAPEPTISRAKSCPLTGDEASNIQHRTNSQLHYHLKLDDVPFILGASSTASHSIVANVQNIIAMMKMHNKALCASKHKFRENVGSKSSISKKSCSQDANEMIQELTEDLSKLTMKQEKLKQMFDNAQEADQCEKAKDEADRSKSNKRCFKNSVSTHPTEGSTAVTNSSKELTNIKLKETPKNEEKHLIFTDKMKTNNFVRRRMLRSLQDFKVHLSEEDILWK